MDGQQLSEESVQDSFHSYLKSSLTQAKLERLLEAEALASAEADLMITGPALCLYFASLRSTTDPPSVPLPRRSKSAPPIQLSASNCPTSFLSFIRVWADNVPRIQSLRPQYQHDLARIICGLPPLAQPVDLALQGIAADLRAVAIEISQRRSFQNRYASDIQAAIDAGHPSSTLKVKTSFVPPPDYGSTSPPSSAKSDFSRTPSPTILTAQSPAIEFIRETLYASLADVIERSPYIRRLLKWDPPRAYFAAVAFAILDVSTTAVTPTGGIMGVLGKELTLEECPKELGPFMAELAAIGIAAAEIEQLDDETAIRCAEREEDSPPPRMERVKKILEEGIGYEEGRKMEEDGRRSVEGRAVAFANRINALALGMTRLQAFKERQADVFKVLAGISSR